MTRRGFTLIELLVVIALLGTLMGLLLPAVQKVRASADKSTCANNLKQIGIALHNHHTTLGHFPPGRGAPAPRIFSAHAYLLPFLDQNPLHGQIDYDAAPTTYNVPPATLHDGSRNFAAATTRLPFLLCPSDPSGRVPGSAYGATNYAANTGSGSLLGNLAAADGPFYLGSAVRLEQITDGATTTAAFGERPLGDGTTSRGGRVMRELAATTDPTSTNCDPSAAGTWNGERGVKWILGNYGNTLYNHALPPNAAEGDCLNATQQKGRMAARGYHLGGVNVLFCDGGVRFVHHSVSPQTWQSMSTISAGETVALNP